MLIVLSTALGLTNLLTLYWAFHKRVKISPQIRALQAAVAAFEIEGQSILRIERIPPDLVFLRNPSR